MENVKFFWSFIGAVAYLQDQFYERFSQLDYMVKVDAGLTDIICVRRWTVGGLNLRDEVEFPLNGQCFVSGEVGHPADFSLLIVYGFYEDPGDLDSNPKVGAWWTTPMPIWEPGPRFAEAVNRGARRN